MLIEFRRIAWMVYGLVVCITTSCVAGGGAATNRLDTYGLIGVEANFKLVSRFRVPVFGPRGYFDFSPSGRYVAMPYSRNFRGQSIFLFFRRQGVFSDNLKVYDIQTSQFVFGSPMAVGFGNNEGHAAFFLDENTLIFGIGILSPRSLIWDIKPKGHKKDDICWKLAKFREGKSTQLICGDNIDKFISHSQRGLRGMQVSPNGDNIVVHVLSSDRWGGSVFYSYLVVYNSRTGELVDFIDLPKLLGGDGSFSDLVEYDQIYYNLDFQILDENANRLLLSYSAQRVCESNCRYANRWEYPAFLQESYVYSGGLLSKSELFQERCAPKEFKNSIFEGRVGARQRYLVYRTGYDAPNECGEYYFIDLRDLSPLPAAKRVKGRIYANRQSAILSGGYHLSRYLGRNKSTNYSLVSMHDGQEVLSFSGEDWETVQGVSDDGCRLILSTSKRLGRKTEFVVYDFVGGLKCQY